jgi:hypothetical protein
MHPDDALLFADAELPKLREATADLSWLYARGYAPESSLKLVGDRHALKLRQRAAVSRCACAEEKVLARRARMQPAPALRGTTLVVDGFNVLTTLEVALSGGIVLVGRDGTLRDIAGVHGSYRSVQETLPALELIAGLVQSLGVKRCAILLDRPVSNSGRLRALIEARARERGWPLEAQVVPDPDPLLERSTEIIASADGVVLERCGGWFNLARACIDTSAPSARMVDLSWA